MLEIFDRILKFIKDKSISWGFKSFIAVIFLSAFLFADYLVSFSYDYHSNKKAEQLISISNLKEIYKSDSVKLKELLATEERVLKRTHYEDRLRNMDFSFEIPKLKILEKSEIKDKTKPEIKKESTITNKPIRNVYWMTITSNYVFIFISIVLVIMPFTGSVHRELKNILGVIAALIIFGLIIYFFTWVSYKIPLIWNKPWLNYLLNAILQSPLLFFIINSSKKN